MKTTYLTFGLILVAALALLATGMSPLSGTAVAGGDDAVCCGSACPCGDACRCGADCAASCADGASCTCTGHQQAVTEACACDDCQCEVCTCG